MSRAPRFIAVVLVAGASLWSLHVVVATHEPFATDAALAIAIGLLLFTVICVVGMLLPRGRWTRVLAQLILLSEIGLAAVSPLRGWAWPALAATALGIVGVQGKWLDAWLRRLPAALGPGVRPMALALGSLALVPLIGVASPAGLENQHGLLAATGVIVAWGYSRAELWALWVGRLLFVPLGVTAALAAPTGGAIVILGASAALAYLAWARDSRLAVSPLMDAMPGSRSLPAKDAPE